MCPQAASVAGLPTLREIVTGCAAGVKILQEGDAGKSHKATLAPMPDSRQGWHMSALWYLRLLMVMNRLKLSRNAVFVQSMAGQRQQGVGGKNTRG